jgi:hypothetical protein
MWIIYWIGLVDLWITANTASPRLLAVANAPAACSTVQGSTKYLRIPEPLSKNHVIISTLFTARSVKGISKLGAEFYK